MQSARAAAVLALFSILLPARAAFAQSGPIRFALIESPIHKKADLEPIATWLGERVGRPVELVIAADYSDMRKKIDGSEVEFAILFPLAFAQALERRPPVELLGCSVRQGKTYYRGYLIAKRDGPIRSLQDLRGKKMGFVDPNSTSGFFYPMQVLRDEGLVKSRDDLDAFFASHEFLGSHEKVVLAVANGAVDAGAVYDLAIADAASRSGVDPAVLRILGRTGDIPHEAVVALPGVDPELTRKFREALLALDTRTDEGRRVLRPLGSLKLNGFVACGQEVFDPIVELLK